MIISVSGYNYSGSSAVIDLLREYDEVNIIRSEIAFLYLPDGLIDLDYHINKGTTYFNADVAIERYWNLCQKCSIPKKYRESFLSVTKQYLDDIAEETWKGNSSFDGTRKQGLEYTYWHVRKLFQNVIWHFFHKSFHLCNRKMYLAHRSKNFDSATERYIERFTEIFSVDGKYPVFDQFFSAFDPDKCIRYFRNGKAIVVDRDPRDIYILGKIKHETACYPSDDPEKFIKWYKSCIEKGRRTQTENVLYLYFEDLVYDYNACKKRIEEFLSISKQVHAKKYFNPDISINNTQLKIRFPELKKEIDMIERELGNCLYSFPRRDIRSKDFF